jgi:hypothetical protein
MLQHRTKLFAQVPRTLNAILSYRENIERRESQLRPFAGFHHCPYIGFVGRSVGCLLHPRAEGNEGVDWRGLSDYGGMACRIYFCPTYHDLANRHKAIARDVAQNWYDYGLVITETRLLDSIFRRVEARIERSVRKEDVACNSEFAGALDALLHLKLRWPYRDPRSSLCHYFFKDQQHLKANIDYDALKTRPSTYDTILVELNSTFQSAWELRQAEAELDRLFGRLTVALTAGSGSRTLS